jgi:hypothetical protein
MFYFMHEAHMSHEKKQFQLKNKRLMHYWNCFFSQLYLFLQVQSEMK